MASYPLAVKLEALAEWNENGWNQAEASEHLGIPRTTLRKWNENSDKLTATDVDPSRKRLTKPGPKATTIAFEDDIVQAVKRRHLDGDPFSRDSLLKYSASTFPAVGNKSGGGQNSWLTRFIDRNGIRPFLIKAQSTKSKTSGVSAKPENLSVFSKPEKPSLSSKHEKPSQPELPPNLQPPTESHVATPGDHGELTLLSPQQPIVEIIEVSDSEDLTERVSLVDQTFSPVVCSFKIPRFDGDEVSQRMSVHEKDLATLCPGEWLDDTAMTYYIQQHIPSYGGHFCFDCQFFGNILMNRTRATAEKKKNRSLTMTVDELTYNYSRGSTITFPWSSYRHVLIPVCTGKHWSFVVAQNPLHCFDEQSYILHVNSLRIHSTEKIANLLTSYFVREEYIKFGRNANPSSFVFKSYTTSPLQQNGDDCGVFVLQFMRRVAIGLAREPEKAIFQAIQGYCTALRGSDRFDPAVFREEIRGLIQNDSEYEIVSNEQ